MRGAALGLLLGAIPFSIAQAQQIESSSQRAEAPLLETYEANTIGWTKDSDDVWFLDVNLSLKYPIAPDLLESYLGRQSRLYFAASARFAQYVGTRDSSPVVGKRFNPKLIWRHVTKPDDPQQPARCTQKVYRSRCEYFDIALAHESNGQSINTPELFRQAQRESEVHDHETGFARDQISRGWDYFELAARRWFQPANARIDASFKYFFPHGPLQGAAEEYNDWENDPEGKPRRRVHGLSGLASWFSERGSRVSVGFETGYAEPFRHNTVSIELAKTYWQLPWMVFYRNGYRSDLALYYKRISSFGVALEVASF